MLVFDVQVILELVDDEVVLVEIAVVTPFRPPLGIYDVALHFVR